MLIPCPVHHYLYFLQVPPLVFLHGHVQHPLSARHQHPARTVLVWHSVTVQPSRQQLPLRCRARFFHQYQAPGRPLPLHLLLLQLQALLQPGRPLHLRLLLLQLQALLQPPAPQVPPFLQQPPSGLDHCWCIHGARQSLLLRNRLPPARRLCPRAPCLCSPPSTITA